MGSRLTRAVLALITVAALAALVPDAADAVSRTPPMNHTAADACAPVWFIGARGSGESASGNDGMGPAVGHMESVVAQDLTAKGMTVTPKAVTYPAASVDVLEPDATVLKLLQLGEVAAATAWYVHTSVDRYDSSMGQGITATEAAVAAALRDCPNARIVLAGYSQGAVAIHDAENWLVNHKPGEFSHIAGTLLLGDPDRVPDSKARLFGSWPKQTEKGEGLRVYWHLVKPHDVPEPATTAEIANADDIVADFLFRDLTSTSFRKNAISTHTSYAHVVKGKMTFEPVLADAANWVASLIPGPGPAGRWTSVTMPVPQGGYAPFVTGMACPSASDCVAAGFSYHLAAIPQAMIVTGSGARWQPVSVPLPAGGDSAKDAMLFALSCPAARLCVAAGYYEDSSGGQHGLLVTISGGTARSVRTPLPDGGEQAQLFSVACASASKCVAGGTYYDGSGFSHALLLTSSGSPAVATTTWAAVAAPLPSDAEDGVPYSQIFAVTCPTVSWCAAPASYWDSAGDTRIAWITGVGTSWQATEVRDPANIEPGSGSGAECLPFSYCLTDSGPYLFSVSCADVGMCAASGSYTNASYQSEDIMIRQSGTASTPAATALPLGAKVGAVTGLGPVVCFSGLTCVAVGAYQDPASDGVPVLAASSGASWHLIRPPLPGAGAASGAPLNSIACASATRCVAVGGYHNGAFGQAFLTVGSGSSWSSGPLPFPAHDGNALDAVACVSGGTCTAAGTSGNDLLLTTGHA